MLCNRYNHIHCPLLLFLGKLTTKPIASCYITWQQNNMNNNYNKTKALLPQAQVVLADFSYPVYTHWLTCSERLIKLFGFPIASQ